MMTKTTTDNAHAHVAGAATTTANMTATTITGTTSNRTTTSMSMLMRMRMISISMLMATMTMTMTMTMCTATNTRIPSKMPIPPLSLKSIVNINDIPTGGGAKRGILGRRRQRRKKRLSPNKHSPTNTATNIATATRHSIVEPVVVVAVKDVENLQNEVLRLHQILDDHKIRDGDYGSVYDENEYNSEHDSASYDSDYNIEHDYDYEYEHDAISAGDRRKAITSNDSTRATTTMTKAQQSKIICSYVINVLNERYRQVMNKQRAKYFARRYKKPSGTSGSRRKNRSQRFKILSAHGREKEDSNTSHENEHEHEHELVVQVIPSLSSPSSYFPTNLQSLDMIFTEEAYQSACTAIQTKYTHTLADHHDMYGKEVLFTPKLILRALRLMYNFIPVTATVGVAYYKEGFREDVWYHLVSRCLAKSGPAFIKWGQWASTRTDIFPDKLCQALSELHADAPSHRWKITQHTVEEALCIPKGALMDVFEEFDHEPVASGSIAQVHRAVLRQPMNPGRGGRRRVGHKGRGEGRGTSVAVKVRHPNVSRMIDMDFRLMSIVANVADRLPALSWLRIRESVEQFSHTMAAQAHLNVEAHHLEVLNYNFRKWDAVNFPTPFFACSSVIIESFEKGEICTTIIDEYDQLAEANNNNSRRGPIVEEVHDDAEGITTNSNSPVKSIVGKSSSEACMGGHEIMPVSLAKFIVTTGLSLYLKMLLVDNLMHADLHPGNIMLQFQFLGEQYADTSTLSPLSSLGDVPVGGASSSCATVARQQLKQGNTVKKLSNSVGKVSTDFYGQVTLVDAGMVAQLDEEESTNFIGLISALGEGDGRAAGEAILRFNNNYSHNDQIDGGSDILDVGSESLSKEEREAFIQDVILLFKEKCRGYGTNTDFGDVLRGVLGIVKKHQVQLSANYATLVVNALCIEGLAKRVCPSYNLLDASKPLLKAYHVVPYDDGSSNEKFLSNKPELRRALVKAFTPMLYIKKKIDDDRFFREIERRRQGIIATPIRKRRHNPLQHLCSQVGNILNIICSNRIYQKMASVGATVVLVHYAVTASTDNKRGHPKNEAQK